MKGLRKVASLEQPQAPACTIHEAGLTVRMKRAISHSISKPKTPRDGSETDYSLGSSGRRVNNPG
jgi:hypothetical protein